MSNPIAILSAMRTPMGGMMGSLSSLSASDLGGVAIRSAISKSGLNASDIDEVLMGSVLTAGQGQAPARQAALAAGLPVSTPCTTVNKVCGSAMKSIMLGGNALRSGQASVVVAGGMESMSGAPYLLPQARQGYRFGHAQMLDHMQYDGLQDAYQGVAMGNFAETCASKYQFSREMQDVFAMESLSRAKQAIEKGYFANEVAPVTLSTRRGDVVVDTDEQPGNAKPEKIPQLRPAFQKDGSVTAANASSISDGAAALTLMMSDEAEARGLKPIALIHGYDESAQEPEWFTTAPVTAVQNTLKRVGWSIDEVDLWEINEAFAVVAMAAMHELSIPHSKLNVHGGACALGHPIGASGARILVTLIHAMQRRGDKKGMASLCIGGGEATAMAIEFVG
ncbi:acetyl-CoA C-acyltransferase [Porticoccaceae bacterium]|jgi:acetyl-CoA C-acetyltransferase|nr:acetyl-CoA C-acyltransferase [Porticoccaceae bacterium]MDA8597420.1 acetyl-CoA C-acyltransferase [Porticoccaceae bacterium]MDA8941181.1 acetyl-CoA C-acyltransferase [Porticoccaceae bacterium]MDA9583870.1 acetyl-CoA C-acyltransferase [Porticoccaceae bacterium]MDB2559170.1 acetyl-CoA C-acyltransferase [Porticoccaceae bacterium]